MIRNKAFVVLVLLLLLSMAAFVSTPANNAANAGSTDPTNNLALVCAPVPTDIGAAVDVFAALAAIEINGHSLISSNHRSDVPNRLGATWVPEVAFPVICHSVTANNQRPGKLDVSLDTWFLEVNYNVICPMNHSTIIG